jgi:hypothetical protein
MEINELFKTIYPYYAIKGISEASNLVTIYMTGFNRLPMFAEIDKVEVKDLQDRLDTTFGHSYVWSTNHGTKDIHAYEMATVCKDKIYRLSFIFQNENIRICQTVYFDDEQTEIGEEQATMFELCLEWLKNLPQYRLRILTGSLKILPDMINQIKTRKAG